MGKTWILLANSHRARCLEKNGTGRDLLEVADFVNPHYKLDNRKALGDVSGDADKGHGRTGHSGTQFEPRTSNQAKERASFARQLADYLNQHSSEHHFESLVLIASSPMLGQVEPLLGHAAKQSLQKSVVADLTSYQKNELRQRVHRAMALPES